MSEQGEWDRKVRLSQTVAPFGVGAIYDFRGESLIACDTGEWRGNASVVVDAPRLARALKVSALKRPKAVASAFQKAPATIPYQRFPRWLFCARCRRLSHEPGWDGGPATCPKCAGRPQLVPMRFVLVCEHGHLGDVDWPRWAHRHALHGGCKVKDRLFFETSKGGGSGLASLVVRCGACGATSDLADIATEGAMRRTGVSCPGKQPWQRPTGIPCPESPRVVQRGATNLYFAEIVSALEIPEPQDEEAHDQDDLVSRIKSADGFSLLFGLEGAVAMSIAARIAEVVGCTAEDVLRVAGGDDTPEADGASAVEREDDEDPIRDPEWRSLTAADPPRSRNFVVRAAHLVDDSIPGAPVFDDLLARIGRVVLATRLREVRALRGFRRYTPSGKLVPPDLTGSAAWLPAIEVYGEGILLTLDEAAVRAWERDDRVQGRAGVLAERLGGSLMESRVPRRITPRFLLLHTLAHMLIRQLSFECGYASASLRERIYCRSAEDVGSAQAGLLVYTAAGDVEGTLGGLVRQGEPPRLAETLLAALDAAAWCSSDPICGESRGQGFDGLNLAACHACALLAETSCDHGNIGLDRAMVVGGPSGVPGYFEPVLDAAKEATIEVAGG